MREIKFRAWDKSQNKMFTHDYISWGILNNDGYELMQFTGVKDKNRVDIYEGDILEWNDVDNHIRYVCEYDTKFPQFLFRQILNRNRPELDTPTCGFGYDSKVIGNIYEHPDFLNPNK